ncbi:acyltransferase [Dokdonella immobilis]|uniref:1-acyl-sn-glycerol-3-phosphate acyltransferases n=1 Tax=Dokdonella immobilis TaxID=578942 RepID=A0A1I4YBQ7_9GAMM|nr:acyltransferase [Dokdonella immobilis]SFN35458.1 1-acyl-sn-glycerol-3-phosphate acyltransferases [Dokdonella immobilis]
MTSSLLSLPRIAFSATLIAVNTVIHATPLLLLAMVKLLVPITGFRDVISRLLVRIAESWIAVNSWLMTTLGRVRIEVEGLQGLQRRGWYLVICNHQSWVDIPVLQQVFNRRIPFLKFFLKSQLIWVPVLGLAWWALDFPFMKRYSREQLAQHPELRGKDIESTRRACEKYRKLPVSVMNFVEGTRFTEAKHDRQGSPFVHLLSPRAGGIAFVLDAMGDMMKAVVDVTLIYPAGRPGIADLLAGRIREVRVQVREIPIPADLLGGDYENDPVFRERFQAWLNALWTEKDTAMSLAARPDEA